MRTYTAYSPTFSDRRRWALPAILRERVETHGDKVFLEYPLTGEEFTYGELLATAEDAARTMLGEGIEPGDRVVLMCGNTPEFVHTWFAAAVGGLVQVPINTAYSGEFLAHQVRTAAPTAAVIEAGFAERFAAIAPACATIRRFYVVGGEPEASAAIELLRGQGWHAEPFAALRVGAVATLPEVHPRDPGAIFFTSGTTGPAKGVVMSHSHMTFFADELLCLTRLTEDDVYMAAGPMFHGNSQFLAGYPALIAGGRFVMRERFSASNWSAWLRDSSVTVTNLIGVMMDFVWKAAPAAHDADNPLRCVFAIPTATAIVDDFKRRFGIETFVESFGMTEIAMPMMTPYGEAYPDGACGLLVEEYYDARIVDPETDEEVPLGEVGELMIRPHTPWTTNSGYYGMPERTVEAWRNLWFHTGDGMKRDEEGWFYFVDRLGDTIRRRGENIGSYEIEQAVLGHDAVAECAAVAAPAAEGSEDEVALFVVVVGELSEEELREWCEATLPAFAVPRYIHFATELPQTPSGKIRKAELRRDAAALAEAR